MNRNLVVTLLACGLAGCQGEDPDFSAWDSPTPLVTDREHFRDAHGRYVSFHGVNLGASSKLPTGESPVSFVGRPFPLSCEGQGRSCRDADWHLSKIRELGFNGVRLLFSWEAVEPEAKGVIDQAFLDYFEEIIARAEAHGLYVLLDMHQDLFSRHLYASYNREPYAAITDPTLGNVGVIFPDPRHMSDPAVPWFTHKVQGDGAPRWAVQACLPEKAAFVGGPTWGVFRPLGLLSLEEILALFAGGEEAPPPPPGDPRDAEEELAHALESYLTAGLAGILPKTPAEGSDFLPMTYWWLNSVLSMDLDRCYAAFYAGRTVFPELTVEWGGRTWNIQDYLQDSWIAAWREVARRAAPHANVIGYDLMNEPSVGFVLLNAVAVYFQNGSKEELELMLRPLLGLYTTQVMDLLFLLKTVPAIPARPVRGEGYDEAGNRIPWDESAESYQLRLDAWGAVRQAALQAYGLAAFNMDAAVSLVDNFDWSYLLPLYEAAGQAILAEDPDAIFWLQTAGSSGLLGTLGEGLVSEPLAPPPGMSQVVAAPHWYPDPEIQPNLGFGMPPRDFEPGELEYYDYREDLQRLLDVYRPALRNSPVVIGEFGTFFNYGGIEWSRANDYRPSAELLDNHYEAYEALGLSNFLWCYNAHNTFAEGDDWNSEDFSVLDEEGEARGERAVVRPFARALSGRPVSSTFYSDYHDFEPQQAISDPRREFRLVFETFETYAPTEIFVPRVQYPDGFYVWLSDGFAAWDGGRQILYVQPARDAPGTRHEVIIRPPLPGQVNLGWRYFFRGDSGVAGGR